MSKLKKFFSIQFYIFNRSEYRKMIDIDEKFNASFRNGTERLTKQEKKQIEFKAVELYRKYQVNNNNIWEIYYRNKLRRFALKTGIDFLDGKNIGPGLIIGHNGKIVINGSASFGGEVMITHGVTIGRDIRGKRAGVPKFGKKICIRTNAVVVGNITIGDDVLIAPNTFVNFDVPSHSVVVGNPATIHPRENATEGHIGVLK